MIKVDDYDVAFAPLRLEGITQRAQKEFAAELPCACAVSEKQLCESCFCRLQIEEYG
jgi:hypothetical protein